MDMYVCFDLETTVNGGPDGDSPEAHWLNNKVLLCGFQYADGVPRSPTIAKDAGDLVKQCTVLTEMGDNVTLVAHNLKFDLKYLMRDYPTAPWEKFNYWDTMTYEYLYSGHWRKFSSLEETMKNRGMSTPGKTLDLGAILASGLKMEDICEQDLRTYLSQDVKMLVQLFKEQNCDGYGVDMRYIAPLAEMELNGLPVDRKQAQSELAMLTTTSAGSLGFVEGAISGMLEWMDGSPITNDDFDPSVTPKGKYIKAMAPRTLSYLFTGYPTPLKVQGKWELVFKQGLKPFLTPDNVKAFWPNQTPTNLGFPFDENKIQEILNSNCKRGHRVLEEVLQYRKANKLASTYHGPMLDTSKLQGCVYPKLNTTVTNTGRLSSSNPNGQNMPPEARSLITASHSGAELVEIDFSQLEMVGSALVTQCHKLITDILNGIDVHFESGKSVFGWKKPADMNDKDRKIVKNVNFGLLYGGKANGLSKMTGVDKAIVQKLIDSFYNRYPDVKQWQEDIFSKVVADMEPFGIKNGEQIYASLYECPLSGRRYLFQEQKSPDWIRAKTGRSFSFSPQQTSNYPIQGFAGGEITLSFLYYLWRALNEHSVWHRFRLTVHDSILLEANKGEDLTVYYDVALRLTESKYGIPQGLLKLDEERNYNWK